MAYRILPLVTGANQSFTCTLPIDGKNITLTFTITYNGIGGYWFMTITDPKTKETILDGVPLLPGEYPAADILGQYSYLGIGSAVVLPTSSIASDTPDDTNLGSDFVLVWGDTVVD